MSKKIQRAIAGNTLLTCSGLPLIIAYTKGKGFIHAESQGVNPFIAFDRECVWGRVSLTSAVATCCRKSVRKWLRHFARMFEEKLQEEKGHGRVQNAISWVCWQNALKWMSPLGFLEIFQRDYGSSSCGGCASPGVLPLVPKPFRYVLFFTTLLCLVCTFLSAWAVVLVLSKVM